MPPPSRFPLPSPVRERHLPPVVKRVPANDHRASWAGRGHVGAFLIQLLALVTVNIALWGFFAWAAIRYAERGVPLPPGSGPL